MSLYEKAVLELLKDEPKQRKQLIEQLCPKIMSIKRLQKTLKGLENDGKIEAISKRIKGIHRWETWYALPGHEYLLDIDAGRAIAAIERLQSILFRPPTPEEIAVETGITPNGAEKLAYKLAGQTGWFNPRPEFIHESTKKLGEVLVCAARIRDGKVAEDGKSENFDYEGDMEIVEEAKRFLKEHREMLPKLSENGYKVSWPLEAQKYLGENYEPKDRGSIVAFKFG